MEHAFTKINHKSCNSNALFFQCMAKKTQAIEDLKVSKKHVFTQACNAAAFQCLISVMIMVQNRCIARPQKPI